MNLEQAAVPDAYTGETAALSKHRNHDLAQHRAAMAGGMLGGLSPYAVNGAAQQALQPRQAFIPEVRDRLGRLHEVLNGANANLSNLRERLFGPWPENSTAGSTGLKGPPAQQEEILMVLEMLIETAMRTREHAGVLNEMI